MSSTIFTAQKVIDGSVRGGSEKGGVKIHPFHLPWIRAWVAKRLPPLTAKGLFSRCIFCPRIRYDGLLHS